MNTPKYGNAYVTLLSTLDYLDAVLVLHESLKEVKSRYPLVCGLTEDIFLKEVVESLTKRGIIVEKIPKLQYSEKTREKEKDKKEEEKTSVLNTASKISLFELIDYDKLCYIDADTMVVENIDSLFNWPDGSMIEPSPGEEENQYGFTGLFIFQPRYHRADFYKKLVTECEGADGDILGSLWFYTRTSYSHRIPYPYCMHYSMIKCLSDNRGRCLPKVIHFCNKEKPWMSEFQEYFKKNNDKYIQKYWNYLEKIKALN